MVIAAQAITGLIFDTLTKLGLPKADAAKVADLMLEADLTGADAHGVFRLPQYANRIKLGAINKHPNIVVTKTAAGTALVDGDNGMGHLAVARAAETAIGLAEETGVAWVGVRNSNHAGSAGVYAAMPLARGMIGIYSAVASANHMAVWGGSEVMLGTNPVAIAIPTGEEAPIVLDMATSVVSYGTIKNYRMQGKQLPEGWMIRSEDGEPLTDASRSSEGLLLPVGGYKGSGLAIVLGLLAGCLNGAPFGRDVIDFNASPEAVCNTGQFIIALDVKRFLPEALFAREVDRHISELRDSTPLPGFDAVRLPGERRHMRRVSNLRDGLTLAPELVAALDQLAAEINVTPLSKR